jgi:Putative zinc-finger
MKSHCIERERIFALAQGMLSGRQERKVKMHVEGCASCRQVFEGYRSLDGLLEEWNPAAEPSPWFDARVRAAVASAEARRPSYSFFGLAWNRWLAAPVLAALLILAGIAVLRTPSLHPVARPEAVPASPVTAQVKSPASEAQSKMDENLSVLEDYDMLNSFEVISELPKGNNKVAD